MKKPILLLVLSLSLGVVLTSCKEEKKEAAPEETKTEIQENHAADKADMAMNDKYQCTMDCEHGKTYDKQGPCPVCKMEMKKVEKEGKTEAESDQEGHNHSENTPSNTDEDSQ